VGAVFGLPFSYDVCNTNAFAAKMQADPCARLPCMNGGACSSDSETFKCACKAGFFGKDCSVTNLQAATNPTVEAGVSDSTSYVLIVVAAVALAIVVGVLAKKQGYQEGSKGGMNQSGMDMDMDEEEGERLSGM